MPPAFALTPLDPLADSEWDALVASHPDAGVFHTSGWAQVLSNTYGHIPHYLRVMQDGRVAALVPFMEVRSRLTGRRGVSLPFSDVCPPLVFEKVHEESLVQALQQFAREHRWSWFELRGSAGCIPANAVPSLQFHGHFLDLTRGASRLFDACSSSVRRAVRKAQRSGLTFHVSTSRCAVREYYRLHARTRRRHGLPPQPLSFFLRIREELLQFQQGFVALALADGHPVAGAIFLHHRRRALYKFGASDERFQHLRGNNLVMWSAIEHLAAAGCQQLEFGRTSFGSDSLRRFKLGWGAREEPLRYYKLGTALGNWLQEREKTVGLHNRIFSALPLVINRAIGACLYPHLD